jgi:REP element-mobilizing transposase RayT
MLSSRGEKGGELPQRRHLRRLDRIFVPGAPLYLVTVCVEHRRRVLANGGAASILVEAWRHALALHGWIVGRYVVMPDHVHFFATRASDSAKTLSGFVGYWKRSTAIRIRRAHQAAGMHRHARPTARPFSWQKEFFDHLLRSSESYGRKWEYVQQNPVRAGLVATVEEWPYQGEINSLSW